MAIIRHFYPNSRVEPGSSWDELRLSHGEEKPMTISLGNLWRNLKELPEGRADEAERFLRVISAPSLRSKDLPDLKNIVPTVKDAEYLATARHQDGTLNFFHEHLVGDLWIVYAIDSPEHISTLMLSQIAELNLDKSSIRALATNNLRRILPPVEQHGDGPMYMLTAGADYVASLLLLDDLWHQFQAETEGDIVAAAPSRDVILFTSSASSEGLSALRKTIERIVSRGSYLVSSSMLRWGPDGWRGFS
jgi:uncharacterized protein YtpQ (UPF0354 family)